MAITSSVLKFETNATLIACGIDSEHIIRFSKYGYEEGRPSPFIYSQKEIDYYMSSDDPITGLCVAFCCKEAVYKALKQAYNFDTCQIYWEKSISTYTFHLANSMCDRFEVLEQYALVDISPEGECIVVVYLLG